VSGQKSGHGSVREGRPAHGADHKPAIRPLRSGPARALAEYSRRLQLAEARRFAAARRWGLAEAPLRAPAPPRIKPGLRTEPGLSVGSGLPPVITRVPTSDRVVFLTIDDGAEKDPRLTRMLRELRVPMSGFLSHYLVRMDYGYFRELSRLGAGMHNHTLNHLNLPLLSYRGQRREICGQQHHLREEFGELPRLFRPPFGNYNRDTLRAAASCGVRVIPLWSEEAFPDHMEFRVGDPRLHPGDIILTHFRGRAEWRATMPDLVRRVLNTATRQGFALARLEDYL
jgi:peptidoglycan/xylan/chitin deacetylase (PgdA/CDA1 family)